MLEELSRVPGCREVLPLVLTTSSFGGRKNRLAQSEKVFAFKVLQLRMTHRPECGGSSLVEVQQGIRVLGALLGHPVFIADQSENLVVEHQTLLDWIPSLEDLQCGWALLLHCASARANYFIRVVRPECSHRFVRLHDEGLWRCLCGFRNIPRDCVAPAIKDQCSLPFVLGGLGLRSATRSRQSVFGPVGPTHFT